MIKCESKHESNQATDAVHFKRKPVLSLIQTQMNTVAILKVAFNRNSSQGTCCCCISLLKRVPAHVQN